MTRYQFPELIVTFLGCSKDPVEILYSAIKTGRSEDDMGHIWQQIHEKRVTREEMIAELPESAVTRTSSLRQAQFVFMVENISRASLQALNRHSNDSSRPSLIRTGFQNTSGNHVAATPPSFRDNPALLEQWVRLQSDTAALYKNCLEAGVDPEDAGYALPQGLLCREQVSMSFQAMQQFLDITLCEQTHWETRTMSQQIFQLMKKEFPSLGRRLGIKCWENRELYCDESIERYESCPWRKIRPHKTHLNSIWSSENLPMPESSVM